MRSAHPPARPAVVRELYQSLMSSRRNAHQRLQSMQDIERRHRDTALADLVELAVAGALHPPHPTAPPPSRDDVQQP